MTGHHWILTDYRPRPDEVGIKPIDPPSVPVKARACWECSVCGLRILFPDFMSDVAPTYRTVGFIMANPDDGTELDRVKELAEFYASDCEHQRVYSVMQS